MEKLVNNFGLISVLSAVFVFGYAAGKLVTVDDICETASASTCREVEKVSFKNIQHKDKAEKDDDLVAIGAATLYASGAL